MGKTDSIKQRRVDVYLDNLEQKQRWKDQAEETGESLSTFVIQCVEYAIEQGGPDFTDIGERSQELQNKDETIRDLREEINQKEIVIEALLD